MKILLSYGTHAKSVIPELTKIADYFEKDEPDFPKELMRQKAKCVRDTIRAIEASTRHPNSSDSTRSKPKADRNRLANTHADDSDYLLWSLYAEPLALLLGRRVRGPRVARAGPAATPTTNRRRRPRWPATCSSRTSKVDAKYNAGFSMYVAAWPLLKNYPGQEFQSGLFGTWMFAQYDGPKPEKIYSDIEGGLGWWRDTRFATETPKFIMGGVALNFSEWANGPGAGKGRDWKKPARATTPSPSSARGCCGRRTA